MKTCKWCEKKISKKEIHKCPEIFLHRIADNEIVIRGKKLSLRWIDEHILVGIGGKYD